MDRERNKRQEAREQLVTALHEGHSWKEESRGPDVPLKRAMAYRLLHAVHTEGSIALQDGRHGHPSKLRGEARAFLEATCREAPRTPSPTLRAALRERFNLNGLGWADYRVTVYASIERWWEFVSSAYLLVSLQSPVFRHTAPVPTDAHGSATITAPDRFSQHRWWDNDQGWKNILNNLRLIQGFTPLCTVDHLN